MYLPDYHGNGPNVTYSTRPSGIADLEFTLAESYMSVNPTFVGGYFEESVFAFHNSHVTGNEAIHGIESLQFALPEELANYEIAEPIVRYFLENLSRQLGLLVLHLGVDQLAEMAESNQVIPALNRLWHEYTQAIAIEIGN